MLDNLAYIKEYIGCRALYNYKEREAIRQALRRNIGKGNIPFKPFVELTEKLTSH